MVLHTHNCLEEDPEGVHLHVCHRLAFVSFYAEYGRLPLCREGAKMVPAMLRSEVGQCGVRNQTSAGLERRCVQPVQCYGQTRGLDLHHQR